MWGIYHRERALNFFEDRAPEKWNTSAKRCNPLAAQLISRNGGALWSGDTGDASIRERYISAAVPKSDMRHGTVAVPRAQRYENSRLTAN